LRSSKNEAWGEGGYALGRDEAPKKTKDATGLSPWSFIHRPKSAQTPTRKKLPQAWILHRYPSCV
jgi:hypothetical protein